MADNGGQVADKTQSLFVEFTHSVLNTSVAIYVPNFYGAYYSQNHKATLLLANGSAIIPVKESVDEVKAKVSTAWLQAQSTQTVL